MKQPSIKAQGEHILVGRNKDHAALAHRLKVRSAQGVGEAWLVSEDGKPVGVESSWDNAASRMRSMGYKVHPEVIEPRATYKSRKAAVTA